ncbi:MAG TPA: DUF5668 domain-containing protein [Candidatus Limnocylindria bacterium]|nr:DUF5668 domain-containing protein [Candidatus Limnocylindria bacterium]
MRINRGLVFWGVALITAGAVALAIQSGVIAGESARDLWRFWPVVLIVIGIAVIAARTPFALVATLVAGLVVGGMAGTLITGWPGGIGIGCGGQADELVSSEGSFAGSASVDLDFNCGELAISTAAGSDWSVGARYGGGNEPRISADDGSLRVSADADGPFGFADRRQEWNVTLPTDADLGLSVDANAASSQLDLDDATFTELGIDANAGEVKMRLPGASVDGLSIDANAGSISIDTDEATTLSGSIEMNAGSLELCVAESASVAITVDEDNITFSHNLDDSGLTRTGDTWSNGGGGAAAITLTVSGNAASFTLNPEDGCS